MVVKQICNHIESFPIIDSHYNRGKDNIQKKYLDNSLSIKKMYNLFIENINSDQRVPYIKYYRIFHTKFSLQFKQPQVDVCNTCIKHNDSIRLINKKNNLKEELTKHINSSQQIYKLIKNNGSSNSPKFGFDLYKQNFLPKSNININYYSRKICMYNLGISLYMIYKKKTTSILGLNSIRTQDLNKSHQF